MRKMERGIQNYTELIMAQRNTTEKGQLHCISAGLTLIEYSLRFHAAAQNHRSTMGSRV